MILRTVRVAAIQATPVILDAEATIRKTVGLLEQAAQAGAELAVLPETFVSLYPSNAWAHQAATFSGSDELWERMWLSSVDVPGPLVDELVAACRSLGIHAVIGVNERESERPGTLYNTMLWLGPDGLLHKHRKLMPTQHERLFHGIGRGDDLRAIDTACGRIGGLICWENRMPLARYADLPAGAADLGGPDRRRLRRLDRPHARDRDRVRRVRHLRSPVHPDERLPGRLPAGAARARRHRQRRRGDRRADVGPDRRRPALRRGGHARLRLRPAAGPPRQALFDAVGHYSRDDVLDGLVGSAPAERVDGPRAPSEDSA